LILISPNPPEGLACIFFYSYFAFLFPTENAIFRQGRTKIRISFSVRESKVGIPSGHGRGDKGKLGTYVSERRKRLALHQSDVAEALGYTIQAISKFEAGDSQISVLTLPELATTLSLSLDDLLSQNPNPLPFKGENPKADPSLLKENITFLRKSKGLSLQEEATLFDLTPRTIINYESGATLISLSSLILALGYYGLKPSVFSYEKLEEKLQEKPASSEAVAVVSTPIVLPLPAVAKTISPAKKWISYLFAGAGILALVGSTSPLWLKTSAEDKTSNSITSDNTWLLSSILAFTITSNVTSSSSSSQGTSSSSNGSSSSANASSSSAGSSSSSQDGGSSSSLSSSSSEYLSPYIPGLKRLDISMAKDYTKFNLLPAGTYLVGVDCGGFEFTESNQDKYRLDYVLEDIPSSGVYLEAYEGGVGSAYGLRNLHILGTVANGVKFKIKAKAYAVGHEDEPVYGTPLLLETFSEAGQDIRENLPGLKRAELLCDGISTEESPVTPGTHTFSLKTMPEDYLERYHASITYQITSYDGSLGTSTSPTVTFSSDAMDDTFYQASFTITSDFGLGNISLPFAFKNPKPLYSAPLVSGLLQGIYITAQKKCLARTRGGSLSLDLTYVSTEEYSDEKYLIRINRGKMGDDFIFDFSGIHGPISLQIPSNLDYYSYYFFSLRFCQRADPEDCFYTAPFSVLIADD
jgi:Predicted transcriptional regulators